MPTRDALRLSALVLLCCCLGVGIPSARASLIHQQNISLKKVVAASNVIVVVQAAKPPTRQVNVALDPSPKKKKCPPFPKRLSRFVVVATLMNRSGLAIPKTIEVAPANWRLHRSMAQGYCNGDPVPSPIVSAYVSKLSLKSLQKDPRRRAILFLHHTKSDTRFAVPGAYEAFARKKSVQELIAPKRSGGSRAGNSAGRKRPTP